MIDVTQEKLLSRPAAARCLNAHIDTITAWIKDGVDGVRLEAVRVGRRWKTSAEALQRFTQRLTRNAQGQRTSSVEKRQRTPRQRRRQMTAAEQRCEAMGI